MVASAFGSRGLASTLERRTNNPQVGRDKFLRGKQKRRHEDAVSLQYVLRFSYSFRADVSGRYRGNAYLWLPDQGSNLGPAD